MPQAAEESGGSPLYAYLGAVRRVRPGHLHRLQVRPSLSRGGPLSDEPPHDPPRTAGDRFGRRRLGWKGELALLTPPIVVTLAVLAFLDVITRQRVLYASLAASALNIYQDPTSRSNGPRTLLAAHMTAIVAGLASDAVLAHTYLAAGVAMVSTIALMASLDYLHPPAVGTSLTFAFRAAEEETLNLFLMALGVTVALVVLERAMLWLLPRLGGADVPKTQSPRE